MYMYMYIHLFYVYYSLFVHYYILFTHTCYIYIYIYINHINHKNRFTPVEDDRKQTIQVSSFA